MTDSPGSVRGSGSACCGGQQKSSVAEWQVSWLYPIGPYIAVKQTMTTTERTIRELVEWLIASGVEFYDVRRRDELPHVPFRRVEELSRGYI